MKTPIALNFLAMRSIPLSQIDPLFGTVKQKYARLPIYPKSHYVVQPERRQDCDGLPSGRACVVGKGGLSRKPYG